MKEDRDKWNQRFSSRPQVAPKAPRFVVESVNRLKPGSVLDLASGDGAAALYLASRGFAVTAADISEVALERLQGFAREQGLAVETCRVDLDQPEPLTRLGAFDNIVMAHFKPEPAYWPLLISLLHPGGKLLLSTFNLQHHREAGFPRRFCLKPDELVNISEQLQLEHYDSVERHGDHMDDYLFCRR